MEIKNIKISENRYNGHFGEGSIFDNSIIIRMSNELFGSDINKVTKDKIASSTFRRSFYDNNMNLVTIEIPAPFIENVDDFMKLINEATSAQYLIVKDNHFDLKDYLNKITIRINDSENEYELLKESELARKIMSISGLTDMKDKSNKDVVNSIDLGE